MGRRLCKSNSYPLPAGGLELKECLLVRLRVILSAKGFWAFLGKTYSWTAGTPAQNPLMDQRITDGVDKRLAAKGLQKVDASANPDLVVLYHAAVGTETELNTMNSGGYRWGYGWGGGMGMSTTTVEKIPVGQLAVDIGDAKTKKVLWMGNAGDTLSDKPEKNEKKINSALDKMFKKFPPPVKK